MCVFMDAILNFVTEHNHVYFYPRNLREKATNILF